MAKRTRQPNPCHGADLITTDVPTTHWGIRLPFKPSSKQLQDYQRAMGHKPVRNKETGSPSFDQFARPKLLKRYPNDPIYTALDRYNEIVKCYGTYVLNLKGSADGRLHEVYTHTPETLRLAMQILQTMPRADEDAGDLYRRVRRLVIAAPDHVLLSRDYSGIEAVMTGYLCGSKNFMRLCLLGVHDFVATHAFNDPAQFEWPDDQLKDHYAKVKADVGPGKYKVVRTGCKRAVYLSLYGGGPGEMIRREPDIFTDYAEAEHYQRLVFDLFPEIPRWHWDTAEEADKKGYITSPVSGFRLHNMDLFNFEYNEQTGKVERTLGPNAKEVIAAGPQHAAACFLADAAIRASQDADLAPYLRLLIHDEILTEMPVSDADRLDERLRVAMEQPMLTMPLPPEWNMGSHVVVKTDSKRGHRWSDMA